MFVRRFVITSELAQVEPGKRGLGGVLVCFISEMVQALAHEAQKQAGGNKALSTGTMALSDSAGILLNMANSAPLLGSGGRE